MIEFIISFLGLISGLFLNRFTKEELDIGKKYFALLTIAILISIIVLNTVIIVDILIGIVIGLVLSYLIKNVYLFLGISALVSLLSNKNVTLLAGLIFIFGLSFAALNNKEISKKFLLKSLIFFFIPFSLLAISIFPGYYTLMSGISIGGLIMFIIKLTTSFLKS